MSLVSFVVLSDLHLETPAARPTYSHFSINSGCQHLALLGDIGLAHDARLFSFLEDQLHKFAVVFYVMGNHEPYDSNLDTAKTKLRAFAERTSPQENHDCTGNSYS